MNREEFLEYYKSILEQLELKPLNIRMPSDNAQIQIVKRKIRFTEAMLDDDPEAIVKHFERERKRREDRLKKWDDKHDPEKSTTINYKTDKHNSLVVWIMIILLSIIVICAIKNIS